MKDNSAVKDVTAHARQMLPAPELFLCSPNVNSSLGTVHVLHAGKEQFLCSPALLQHSELFRSANFAKKQQINNICLWYVPASITGEHSARKRRYLQLSWSSPARPGGTNCSSAERSKATGMKHQCCYWALPLPVWIREYTSLNVTRLNSLSL